MLNVVMDGMVYMRAWQARDENASRGCIIHTMNEECIMKNAECGCMYKKPKEAAVW